MLITLYSLLLSTAMATAIEPCDSCSKDPNKALKEVVKATKQQMAKPAIPTALAGLNFGKGERSKSIVKGQELIDRLKKLGVQDLVGKSLGRNCKIEITEAKDSAGKDYFQVVAVVDGNKRRTGDGESIYPKADYQKQHTKHEMQDDNFKPIPNYTGESTYYDHPDSTLLGKTIGIWTSDNFPGSFELRVDDEDCSFVAPLY